MILQFLSEPLIALAEFLVNLFPAFPRFDSLAVTLDPVAYVIRFMDLFVSMKTVSRCLLVILMPVLRIIPLWHKRRLNLSGNSLLSNPISCAGAMILTPRWSGCGKPSSSPVPAEVPDESPG